MHIQALPPLNTVTEFWTHPNSIKIKLAVQVRRIRVYIFLDVDDFKNAPEFQEKYLHFALEQEEQNPSEDEDAFQALENF
jgi:hypothetical protein